MRPTLTKQTDLFAPPEVAHALAQELAEIDAVLSAHPEWVTWVEADLTINRGVSPKRGRPGPPASLVFRVALLKHKLNMSLRRLAIFLADSLSLRDFVGLSVSDATPKRSTLQADIAKIQPATWGRVMKGLAQSSEAQEYETGEKVRVDATVVETNIHHPTDSSLLWDSLRVLARLMRRAEKSFGLSFKDPTRRAKRLRKKINYARRQAQRLPAYRELIDMLTALLAEASRVSGRLFRLRPASWQDEAQRLALIEELATYQQRAGQVMDQARRRVLEKETVPVAEKLFSIFEPHTDLIIKRTRHPEYGHKITLTAGASGMILDCVVERGNPADVTLATRQLARVEQLFGTAPKAAAFDGGYASKENLKSAKALGVERCAFNRATGITQEEMAGSRRSFGRLKDFRAGVEGLISNLKRDFGLSRCTWKGLGRFTSYVWSAILAFNLTKLARLRLRSP